MNQAAFFKTFIKRELFSRKTYSLQVILSVAIGVGAVAGIQSYKSSLTQLISSEARNMMGSDIVLQTPEKFRDFQFKLMDRTLPPGSKKAEVVQFLSMLQNPANEEVSLSLIRAMEESYPFYGGIETSPPDSYKTLDSAGIILEDNLAKNLGLSIGDKIRLGDKFFRLHAILTKEPGSVGGFTGMAPTSIVRRASLIGSGLEERGSRIRYMEYIKLPANTDSSVFKDKYFDEYNEADLTILHNTEVNSGSQLFITNTLDFLSLLGLSSFFLGAIAIFISTRTRVLDSQKQISILKCLGLESRYVRMLVVGETVALSLIGSIAGLALGYWIQSSLPNILSSNDIPNLGTGLTNIALLESIGLGLLVPIFVSVHSLIKAGNVSPINALKNPEGISLDDTPASQGFGKYEYVMLAVIFVIFFLIAWLDTGNILKGLVLCSIFFVLPLLIWLVYLIVRYMISVFVKKVPVARVSSLVFKKFIRQYGLVSLSIIGLGAAIFVLLLSLILRESLLQLGGGRQIIKRPNVFVLDIRSEQKLAFDETVQKFQPKEYRLVPVIGARLSKINGEKIDKSSIEKDARKRDWRATARTREYMLSYRDDLYETESVTSGEFWNSNSKNEISVEKDFSKYLGAGIGDELEFSVQGFPVKGKITNLRSVNWSDMKPNFVVLFSGGDLEAAPRYYLSSFFIESPEDRFALQKVIVKDYPNITFIDTEKAVKSFEGIIVKVSGIINIMSSLLIFASVLLLVSVLYSSARERLRELVLYRVVGAEKIFVRKLIFQEALLLSFFAFFSSLALSLIADFVLNRFVLELESVYPVLEIGLVGIFVFVGVILAYYLTSRRLFSIPVKQLMKSTS
ncbi:ABC transporter permease [Leptospira sp. GIMC2001]|uniref:ABC transporter permease n=1 Tax=Leptospira sp. GIMC2001 TaxID=1513297 RepID=UPI00234B985D|nr:FtsX-like permease family protein [Leptospira sp. GIMC2001]WCL49253.1 FtsX-like permease family protein [Leptospira sp. GIMC2001]